MPPNNVVVIGLTGGISSGKSTVTQEFEKFASSLEGVSTAMVMNADLFGHQAYEPGTECFKNMVEHFGEDIVNKEDGTIDRKKLGPIVFSDPKQLEALNSIVWPAIRKLIEKSIDEKASEWKEKKEESGTEKEQEKEKDKEEDQAEDQVEGKENGGLHIILLEAAVLIEAKWNDLCDELWITTVSKDIAKERLMKRNNLSSDDALKRINSQITNEERRKVAHVEIQNDSDQEALVSRIQEETKKLVARYSKLSAFEIVDVVSEDDQVLYPVKRAVVREFQLLHRASFVILVHPSGKFYVQRRSMLKDSGPGLLDPAPGGVLSSGETYEINAKREMEEELGLTDLKFKPVAKFRYKGPEERGGCWGKIFVAETAVDISDLKLQKEEVEMVTLMEGSEILAMDTSSFLADGLEAFKKFKSTISKA